MLLKILLNIFNFSNYVHILGIDPLTYAITRTEVKRHITVLIEKHVVEAKCDLA